VGHGFPLGYAVWSPRRLDRLPTSSDMLVRRSLRTSTWTPVQEPGGCSGARGSPRPRRRQIKVGGFPGSESRSARSSKPLTCSDGAPSGTRTPNPLSLRTDRSALPVGTPRCSLTCTNTVLAGRLVTRPFAPILVQSRGINRCRHEVASDEHGRRPERGLMPSCRAPCAADGLSSGELSLSRSVRWLASTSGWHRRVRVEVAARLWPSGDAEAGVKEVGRSRTRTDE
jgi:hypothetical protein